MQLRGGERMSSRLTEALGASACGRSPLMLINRTWSRFPSSGAPGGIGHALEQTYNDIARCVAGVISSIEFPKPKGGGGVQVNYPFTFRPTGG